MSKSPSLRRILADIRELSVDPSDQYHAAPLEHDMFEWHFTIRGAEGTDFAGGVYHGRILLPPEYPFKPPDIVFLTPSGRFETGVKVCLSFSAHHPELWQPAWGIRLILEALISFLPTPADGAIGALDWTSEERRKLARESAKFRCPVCCGEGETCAELLPELKSKGEGDNKTKRKPKFQEEIEKLKMLQFQNHAAEEEGVGTNEASNKSESAGGVTRENQPFQPADSDPFSAPKPPSSTPQQPKRVLESKETVSDPKSAENQTKKAVRRAAAAEAIVSPPHASHQRSNENNATTELREPPSRYLLGDIQNDLQVQRVVEGAIKNGRAFNEANATTEPGDAPLPPHSPPGDLRSDPQVQRVTTGVREDPRAPHEDTPMVSDHLLNVMIGFFSVVVIILLQKCQTLLNEWNDLVVVVEN